MSVTIELNAPHGWRLLIDGRPTQGDAHFKTARDATERAQIVSGARPLPPLVRGYLETALWASTDPDSGAPLDRAYSVQSFSERARATALEDCLDFASAVVDDIEAVERSVERIGHDFWLTRNRHGAGFWDGDYPEPHAARLTAAAHAAGSQNVLPTADGKLELG